MENRGTNEEFPDDPRKKNVFMTVLHRFSQLDNKSRNDDNQENFIRRIRSQPPPQVLSLPPSEYMRQVSMTTEERMEMLTKDIRSSCTQNILNDSNICHDFEVIPRMLVFQHYDTGTMYNVSLVIRNIGKVIHYLKPMSEKDPIFTINYKGTTSSVNIRLAPGMNATYDIRFSPDEKRDYEYTINFTTDSETFTVPIIAIGPRPILDFPDVILIPETAVKICSSKSLLVRNLGDCAAIFNLFTSSPYFWIEPTKGIIEEEETVQFVVKFLSKKVGFFEDDIFLRYENDELVRIHVQSSAINCNVRLERGSLRMQDETYIGLATSKTLKIFNRSEYIVKYCWMRYQDDETDKALKSKYTKIFELINNFEVARCVDLVHYNICLPQVHELVCHRIHADEIASLLKENFQYNSSTFSILPTVGEIWPQSSTDVTVIFEPDEIGEISSVAYLEVTGREERIPLKYVTSF